MLNDEQAGFGLRLQKNTFDGVGKRGTTMAAIVRTVGDKLMGTAARLYQNALGSQLAQYGAYYGTFWKTVDGSRPWSEKAKSCGGR